MLRPVTRLVLALAVVALLHPSARADGPPPSSSPPPAVPPAAPKRPAPAPKSPGTPAAAPKPSPAPAAQAAEPSPVEAEEITVTATRDERPAVEVPYSVAARNLAGAESGLDRTAPEALRGIPAVQVQQTGPGQLSPFVRGLTGYHTLWLIDGIRLNNSTFRSGPNQYGATIDPFLIERIELVRGPHSALYGSDAVGGTLQVFSRAAPDREAPQPFGGRLLYRHASADSSHVERLEAWGRGGPIGGTAGLSVKHFGDVDAAGLGELPGTGYREWDADGKIAWDAGDALRITGAVQHTRQLDVPRTHRTVDAVSYRGSTVGSELRHTLDQERTLAYVRAAAEGVGVFERAEATASWHRQGEGVARIRSGNRRDDQHTLVDTFGLRLLAASKTPVGTLTFGLEHDHDEVDTERRDYNADGTLRSISIQGPVADDATYDLFGAYVQDQLEWEMLEVILGLRYTFAAAHARGVQDPASGREVTEKEAWHDLSASLRLGGHFGAVHPFVGLSQGFRAPNLSDLSRFDTALTNELEVPTSNLDPERFLQLEAGAKLEWEPVTVAGSVHYTWVRNLIIRRPTGELIEEARVVAKDNAGAGWIAGLELEGSVKLGGGFAGFGGFSWLDGYVDTYPTSAPAKEREVLDKLQPVQGRLGLRYASADERVVAEAVARLVRHQERLSTRDSADTSRIPPGGSHGFAVFGVRGSVQLFEHLRLFGAVENLGNRAYREHGSGVNAPGTNAIAGLELRW